MFEIAHGTTHDGPGSRTTVFLAGCPLRCLWCQNPEGMSGGVELFREERRCIGCLECIAACATGALAVNTNAIERDRSLCAMCGACVEACPSQAIEFASRDWDIDSLLDEVLKDREYYETLGGGVTVSGGEPLSRHDFVRTFFRRLREQGVHTALDTCGFASKSALDAVLPYTDHVLFDLKVMESALHEHFTGQPNRPILRNLLSIADTIRGATPRAMKLWIRTPLIPGATATTENLAAIGAFIHQHLLDVTDRWELCAFNNACDLKYGKLGLPWAYGESPLMDQSAVDESREAALSTGFARERLVVSGLIAGAPPGDFGKES